MFVSIMSHQPNNFRSLPEKVMEGSSPPLTKAESSATKITDLDDDAFAHCAGYLNLHDVSNMAMACKPLRRLAYSDSIWMRFFRERWPHQLISGSLQSLGIRESYFARQVELHKLKFEDPFAVELYGEHRPFDHVLLDKDNLVFSQGSMIQVVQTHGLISGAFSIVNLNCHKARVTCLRSFPLVETSLFRSESQRNDNVLLTSSSDHTIRLWWKGSCQRCFRGHNGPVTTLSDNLLGDGGGKIFASGGEDGTLRLWSLNSSGKRGQHALKATLYGHEKPIKFMSVAGHKTSLLVSIANDSKVRVWDVVASASSGRSSCCVGMTSLPGSPVSMKCHDSLLYVAAGSSVVAIDLRTMQKVFTAAVSQPKVNSFAMLPSASLVCTGGDSKAMLWDIRRNQSTSRPEAATEMDGHKGPITLLHMDQYKIVTGGPEDSYVNVWETDTGMKANSLKCCEDAPVLKLGCSAMAIKGCQVVTASYDHGFGGLCFRDFSTASLPILKSQDENASKFWNPQNGSESDEDSDGTNFEDDEFY